MGKGKRLASGRAARAGRRAEARSGARMVMLALAASGVIAIVIASVTAPESRQRARPKRSADSAPALGESGIDGGR
jgi:hypothetical protein